MNRITRAYGSGHPTEQYFSYDWWGNLLRENNWSEGQVAGQYAGYKNRRVGRLYDDAGNQTQDGQHGYAYDAENRLIQVDGGVAAVYDYDDAGRRVRRSVGGVRTYYVYGVDGQVLSEFTVDTGLVTSQTQAPAVDAETHYLHQDHLGTPRVITNQAGTVVGRHDYYPFGDEITASNQTDGERRKFTGKERDPESGLDYFGARYFSSVLGRFTSPDEPLVDQFEGDPQSWNLYAYTRNNPLRFFDPTGRACRVRSNGSQYDDDSGGQSCKEVEARDKQGIKPSAIVTAERGNLPTAFALNTLFALDAVASSYFRPLTNLIGIRPSYMEPIPVSQEYVGQIASATVFVASMVVGPGGPLSRGARKVLGSLSGLAEMTVAEAVRARGGGAAQVNYIATWLQQKTLGEVAGLAAKGDPEAKTAIKIIKEAARLGQK